MTTATARSLLAILCRPSARNVVMHIGRAALLLAAILFGTAALAQTPFRATLSYDGDPPTFDNGAPVTATIFLYSDTGDVSNISFTSTLPAGVSFYSTPAASQCGGTVTSTATSFSLAGGAFLSNNGCNLMVVVKATPATQTVYTLNTGTISYFQGQAFTDRGASADFTVLAGQPPAITSYPPYGGTEGEGYFYTVTATGDAPITFSATGLPPGLTIDGTSGDITGTPTTVGSYSPTITATNAFPPAATQSFDMNIDLPPFQATKTFSPATIATGGTSTMHITLINNEVEGTVRSIFFTDDFPGGMTTAPGTSTQCGGTLTATATSVTFQGGSIPSSSNCVLSVPVRATARTSTTLTNTTSSISFDVEESLSPISGRLGVVVSPPRITSSLPPNGLVGGSYFHQINVTGTPPIAVVVTGLPPGLTFNTVTHTITGSPTKVGNYPGSIVASNGVPPNATQNYTIVISAPPLTITTDVLPPISGGDHVNVPVVAVGGIPPYTFTLLSGALPPGLAFTPDGYLTGTPTLPGTYTFNVQAVDSIGTKATHVYTIVIAKSAATFGFVVTPDPAISGQPAVVTATLTGGAGTASGTVQVWVAHSYERCPAVPGTLPVAAKTVTSPLGADGTVQFSFADLDIDNYQVCGTYSGDVRYVTANAGPIDLFVLKGVLLGAPTVTLSAPSVVKIGAIVGSQVSVVAPATAKAVPQGNVVLRSNGVIVGMVALNGGVATFTTTAPMTQGAMTLTASYYGDGAFPPAVSSAAVVKVQLQVSDPILVPTLAQSMLALLMAVLALTGVRAAVRRSRR